MAKRKKHPDPQPGFNYTDTSRAAAKQISNGGRSKKCRDVVYQCLCESIRGLIHEEISERTGIRLDTVKPRVHELGLMGLVDALQVTRPSSSGAYCTIFIPRHTNPGLPIKDWPVERTNWPKVAFHCAKRLAALGDAMVEHRISDDQARLEIQQIETALVEGIILNPKEVP